MEDPEFIVVCVDNSYDAYHSHNFRPQRDAIEHYCKAKLAANPETKVVIFTMGAANFGILQDPTSDFQEILDTLRCILNKPAGVLRFSSAIYRARTGFIRCPPNKPKRMIFFVGCFVDLFDNDAVRYGMKLRGEGIAVDVVNFYLEGTESIKNTKIGEILQCCIEGELKSSWMELDAFVDAAKSYDNGHIAHVEPGSSIRRVLSKSILRNTPRLSTNTDHDHKKATHAAGDNKCVRSEAEYGKRKREAIYLENEEAKLGKRKREAIYA